MYNVVVAGLNPDSLTDLILISENLHNPFLIWNNTLPFPVSDVLKSISDLPKYFEPLLSRLPIFKPYGSKYPEEEKKLEPVKYISTICPSSTEFESVSTNDLNVNS